jgi:hypothetical protein
LALSVHEPDQQRYGLRPGEPKTITTLARNLDVFGGDLGLS